MSALLPSLIGGLVLLSLTSGRTQAYSGTGKENYAKIQILYSNSSLFQSFSDQGIYTALGIEADILGLPFFPIEEYNQTHITQTPSCRSASPKRASILTSIPSRWVAIIYMNHCLLSDRVRLASTLGADAVLVIGDPNEGLEEQLTPPSPDLVYAHPAILIIQMTGQALFKALRLSDAPFQIVATVGDTVIGEKDSPLTLQALLFIIVCVLTIIFFVIYMRPSFRRCRDGRRLNMDDLLFEYNLHLFLLHRQEAIVNAIDACPKQTYSTLKSSHGPSDLEIESCAICLEDFTESSIVRVLTCKHWFHATCVDPWLLSAQNCPLCKNPLLSEETLVELVSHLHLPPSDLEFFLDIFGEELGIRLPSNPNNTTAAGDQTNEAQGSLMLPASSSSTRPPRFSALRSARRHAPTRVRYRRQGTSTQTNTTHLSSSSSSRHARRGNSSSRATMPDGTELEIIDTSDSLHQESSHLPNSDDEDSANEEILIGDADSIDEELHLKVSELGYLDTQLKNVNDVVLELPDAFENREFARPACPFPVDYGSRDPSPRFDHMLDDRNTIARGGGNGNNALYLVIDGSTCDDTGSLHEEESIQEFKALSNSRHV